MVSAGDLMTLYMGLELQSLALYVVASLRRDSVKSYRSRAEYFVLGALSSGLLLYGVFAGLWLCRHYPIRGRDEPWRAKADLAWPAVRYRLCRVWLAFQVSAVPFHMWTPDVYEGAPTPVTAFFATSPQGCRDGAVCPRVALMPLAMLSPMEPDHRAAVRCCPCSLVRLLQLGQTNIKRLMAYSRLPTWAMR